MLYTYLFLWLISFVMIFDLNNRKVLYFFAFLMLTIFSFVIRFQPFENDFLAYSSFLSGKSFSIDNFYYTREVVYWGGTYLIYNIFGNESYTFIFVDMLFFLIFTVFCYVKKLPVYLLLVYFLIFPSVLGLLNVYRQFLATTLITIFVFSNVGWFKKMLIFIVSFFIHNVSFIFYSFILLYMKKYFYAILFFVFSMVITYFSYSGKSDSDTGSFNPIIYVFFIGVIFFLYLFVVKFKIYKDKLSETYGYLFSLIFLCFSIVLMGSGQSKRIGMILFVISFVQFVLHYECLIKNPRALLVLRYIVVFFAGLSSLLLPASFEMLNN